MHTFYSSFHQIIMKKVQEHHQTVDCTLKGQCVCGQLFGVRLPIFNFWQRDFWLLESWMRYLRQNCNTRPNYDLHVIKKKHKTKWHTRTPTHGLASTLRMCTAISPGQWSHGHLFRPRLGLISMVWHRT